MKFVSLLTSWVAKKIEPFRAPFQLNYVEDLPKKLKKRTLYVIREDGFDEYAAMLCPCGCNKILYLNLIPDERPCWELQVPNSHPISLHPSIDRKVGCHSHFWFKKGKIIWC